MPTASEHSPVFAPERPWRWPGAALLAAAITCGLFALMYYFTAADGGGVLGRSERPLVLDFVRVERAAQVIEKTRVPPPKPEAAQPPAHRPRAPSPSAPSLRSVAPPPTVRAPAYTPGVGGALDAIGFAGTREVVPLARVSPLYPPRAERLGIEGWVRIAFIIDEHGEVVEPRVVEAEPEKMFDRAALSAVSRWRYQPQIIDGQAVRRAGVEVIIRFQLPED